MRRINWYWCKIRRSDRHRGPDRYHDATNKYFRLFCTHEKFYQRTLTFCRILRFILLGIVLKVQSLLKLRA